MVSIKLDVGFGGILHEGAFYVNPSKAIQSETSWAKNQNLMKSVKAPLSFDELKDLVRTVATERRMKDFNLDDHHVMAVNPFPINLAKPGTKSTKNYYKCDYFEDSDICISDEMLSQNQIINIAVVRMNMSDNAAAEKSKSRGSSISRASMVRNVIAMKANDAVRELREGKSHFTWHPLRRFKFSENPSTLHDQVHALLKPFGDMLIDDTTIPDNITVYSVSIK